MKKEDILIVLVLTALLLALVVMVFNTAHLFGLITPLEGREKTIAMYFIGISAEFSIFLSIYAGHKTAGYWFAGLSFFVGMTFHNWNEPVFLIEVNDKHTTIFEYLKRIQFVGTKHFFATLLLQSIATAIVIVLTEVFMRLRKYKESKKELASLNEAIAKAKEELSKQKANINNNQFTIQQLKADWEQLTAEQEQLKEKIGSDMCQFIEEKAKLEQIISDLKADIKSLKYQRNGTKKGKNKLLVEQSNG